jgi:hypothetical protein
MDNIQRKIQLVVNELKHTVTSIFILFAYARIQTLLLKNIGQAPIGDY